MCIGGGAERQEAGMYETMMAQQAQKEIDYWKKGGFRDLEDAAILDAKKQTSDNKMQIARGQSHVASISQLGKAQKQLPVTDPNSGASKQLAMGMNTATGDALARASNDADLVQRQKGKSGLMDMAAFGRGEQNIGIQGLNAAANFEAGNNATNLALKRSAEDFNAETIGGLGGLAAGYFGGKKPDKTLNDISGMNMDFGNPTAEQMRAAEARVGYTLR